jgi:hypothetical protein
LCCRVWGQYSLHVLLLWFRVWISSHQREEGLDFRWRTQPYRSVNWFWLLLLPCIFLPPGMCL